MPSYAKHDALISTLLHNGELLVHPNTGRVWARGRNDNMCAFKSNGRGYLVRTVYSASGKTTIQAHRVVWIAVHGVPADETLAINHIDGVKSNNAISNLELISQRANMQHAHNLRLIPAGEARAGARYTDVMICDLFARVAAGESFQSISENMDIDPRRLSDIIGRRIWRHVCIDEQLVADAQMQ